MILLLFIYFTQRCRKQGQGLQNFVIHQNFPSQQMTNKDEHIIPSASSARSVKPSDPRAAAD